MLALIADLVLTAIMLVCIAVLAMVTVMSGIWPLWLPVAILGAATVRLWTTT